MTASVKSPDTEKSVKKHVQESNREFIWGADSTDLKDGGLAFSERDFWGRVEDGVLPQIPALSKRLLSIFEFCLISLISIMLIFLLSIIGVATLVIVTPWAGWLDEWQTMKIFEVLDALKIFALGVLSHISVSWSYQKLRHK